MMGNKTIPVVVSVSLGTACLMLMLTVVVVVGVACATVGIHSQSQSPRPVIRPSTGVVGEIEHSINDLKYGPVNVDATKEVKNRLFDRLRQRAVSQSSVVRCQPAVNYQAPVVSCHPVVSYPPIVSQRIMDPSDCNYSYTISNPVVGQTIITQSTGLEMPAIAPINPLLETGKKRCPECETSRNAVKTGAFICSNCRQAQVGNWHTDWNGDGTPTTFLCKRCHALMTPEQRQKALTAYQARQFNKLSHSGLLHQELGQ